MTEIYGFEQILLMDSYKNYQLPVTVLDIIRELELQVNQTIQTATASLDIPKKHYDKSTTHHSFMEKRRFHSRPNFAKSNVVTSAGAGDDPNWNTGKSIKITPKLVSENTDKTITEIRSALNKLSTKNIDIQCDIIYQNIQTILDTGEEDAIEKIAQLIFDIASSNKFMSELYAELYKNLVEKFAIFQQKLVNLFENYKESLNDIVYVNPNDDYNGYCKYTKTNDSRKALTAFIVNLMKKNVLTEQLVLDMILYMEDIILRYAAESERTNEVEEITENLFILMSQSDVSLNTSEIWIEQIIPKVNELSKLRKTNGSKYPSMTTRASFKFMDILDHL
jgi:hypothetical protein